MNYRLQIVASVLFFRYQEQTQNCRNNDDFRLSYWERVSCHWHLVVVFR